MVRVHPFVADGDRFYCHIIDLFMTRHHAAELSCSYFKEGKQIETLPVEVEDDDDEPY